MSELKAKDCACPFCNAPHEPVNHPAGEYAKCSNYDCALRHVSMPISQWNARPREMELERRLETSAIALRLLSNMLRNRSEAAVTETSVQQCVQIADYEIYSINAVLGKGGE